ncbi:MAG: hypothetical protein KDL87_17150, partial [Verrucomicrobiae bacterium]|nr:hypothetical protein [Verrucomicrobiae bacterium]
MKKGSIHHLVRIVALVVAMLNLCGVVSAVDPAPVAGPALGTYAGRLPFFGTFPADTHLTNGYACLKVSRKGAVSGTFAFAGYVYRVKSALVAGVMAPVTLTHRTGPSVVLEITAADEFSIVGSIHRVGDPPIFFDGGHALLPVPRYTSAAPFPFHGLYTLGLDHVKSTWNGTFDEWDHTDFLNERGYGLMKIAKSGVTSLKGQLPDGTKYAASSCATLFGVENFQVWVYAAILKGQGSVVGFIHNLVNTVDPDDPVILSGTMRWYPDRFTHPERSWLVATGSEYNPPETGVQILDVGFTLGSGLGGTLTQENFWDGGFDMNHSNLWGLLAGAPAPASPPAPYETQMGPYSGVVSVGPGPTNMTVAFKVKTGAFKATFIHPGTNKKTYGYGAIIQHRGVFDVPGLVGTQPGFGYGVFVNKVRQPDKSILS